MKSLIIILALVSSSIANATSIGVGYHSKYAVIWRFYERNYNGGFDPKVLVYNITSEPVTMFMKIVVHGSVMNERAMNILYQFTGLTTDTVIRPVIIPAHGYGIYRTEQLLADKSTGFFDCFVINGEGAGIEPVRAKLELADAAYKYYSYDAIGGTPACLIGTNALMIAPGEEGHMTLYYNQVQAQRKNWWNINEWKFDLALFRGAAAMHVTDPAGKTFSAGPAEPKTSFALDIAALDSFALDISYSVFESDSLPGLSITRHFCNGCSNGMRLPVFLKR